MAPAAAEEAANLIELRNLSAGHAGRPVLTDISLAFPPGQITVLAGPNGCGKTTLLRTALGLQPPLAGQVLYDGRPAADLTAREIARCAAYLPQSRTVPGITGRALVLHGRFPWLDWPRRYRPADYAAVQAALEKADAAALADRPLPELSGGERQKLYLAMALAQDTPTVFLDEPTTGLDIRHQLALPDTARALAAEGKAVVAVLHDLCLALRCADTLAVFADGQLQAAGPPADVLQSGTLQAVFGVTVCKVDTPDGPRYYI